MRNTPTNLIQPFMLGAIYRVTEAQKILDIGRDTMMKLKREGLPFRRVGNKDYVLSDDLWEAMQKIKRTKKKAESVTSKS